MLKRLVRKAAGIALLAAAGGILPSAAALALDDPGTEEHLYAIGWGLTLKSDGSGFYNELMQFVLAEAGYGSGYRIMPYKRAIASLQADQAGCLYPAHAPILKPHGLDEQIGLDLVASAPFLRIQTHLFSRPDAPALSSLEALRGKRIGHPTGSPIAEVLAPYGARYLASLDETAKARLLLTGRVDYISATLPDAIFVFQSLGEPLPPYNAGLSLITTTVGVVCREGAEGQVFLARLNAALHRLREDGRLAAFFDGRGIDVATHMPAGRPTEGIGIGQR